MIVIEFDELEITERHGLEGNRSYLNPLKMEFEGESQGQTREESLSLDLSLGANLGRRHDSRILELD